MKIQYKSFDGRYTHYLTTEVVVMETYKGHYICKDSEGWLFVKCDDNWQYFGTMREAKRFIDGIAVE